MAQKSQHTELFYVKDPNTIVKILKLTGVTGTGGTVTQIDTTDLDSIEEESIAGIAKPGAVAIPMNFDPKVQVHQDLYQLYLAGANLSFILGLSDDYPVSAPPTIANGAITYPATRSYIQFNGYIADFPIDAAMNSKLESSLTIQRSGPKNVHFKAVTP